MPDFPVGQSLLLCCEPADDSYAPKPDFLPNWCLVFLCRDMIISSQMWLSNNRDWFVLQRSWNWVSQWVLSFKALISGSCPFILTRLSFFKIWLKVPFWICCNPVWYLYFSTIWFHLLLHLSSTLAPTTELFAFSWTHPARSHLCDLVILI